MQALDKTGAASSGLSSRTVVPSLSLLLESYCQFHLKADLPVVPRCAAMHAKSLQLCTILCDPMDCSPPGSSVLGILLGRILE